MALGGFIAVETARLRAAPLYSHVGPRLFPALVAGGIILIGLLLARQAVQGGWPKDSEEAAEPIRWRGFGLISAGLLLQMLLIERLGFVLSSSILFWFVAAGFGSRRPIRDAAVGIALAVLTFLGFTRGLDLSLPAGVLGGIF